MKSLFFFFALFISLSSFSQVGAVWTTPTTGTIDGVSFVITGTSGSTTQPFDLSTVDFSGAPLSASQDCLDYEGYSNVTITLSSPIELYFYAKYWRTDTYTFSDPVTFLSGSNLTVVDPLTTTAVSYADGVYRVDGMVSTFTITSTNQTCCSHQVMTFGGIACQSSQNSFSTTICGSYTVPSGDEMYNSSGIYMDTIPNVAGCDSVLTIDVTINVADVSLTNDTSLCLGDSVTMIASAVRSLTTTFAAGNTHRGNMFDIVAINEVTIDAFDAHPTDNTDYEIYYKLGSYLGFEDNAAAWTLVGSAFGVVAQPLGTPTPLPINVGITIPAGQTYAFYVTSTNVAVAQNYTDGTTAGAVFASDANIQFLEGAGMEYPFTAGGALYTPRIFNGNIHYSTAIGTTYLWSNASTSDSIVETPTVQTTYYVDITLSGCPTVTDSVTIYVNPAVIVDLGLDTALCPGAQITLDAGNSGSTYDWNNGIATTQTVSGIPGTDYFVEVMSAEGCFGYDTINVAMGIVPVVDLGLDTVLCAGSFLTLDAGNAGSTYDWTTPETTQIIGAIAGGTYGVLVTSADGCTDSTGITIGENPLPTIDLGADITFCVNESSVIDAGSGYSSYLWSTTETTQTVLADGATLGVGVHTFTIEVTDSIGCTNTDDIIVNVDGCVGLIPVEASHMHVYPNPTSDVLNIQVDQLSSLATLVIYSANGTVIFSEEMSNQTHVLDLRTLVRGSYILELNTDDFREIIRLIKN